MTFLETIQYIRNKIAQIFTPAVQPADVDQTINFAMTSVAILASDAGHAVDHLRTAALALAANPNIARAAHAVSNALGAMGVDAEAVFNAASNDPEVHLSFIQALPALLAIRNANQMGVSDTVLYPIVIETIQPILDTVLNVADNIPGGARMRSAMDAVIERVSADMNVRNTLMATFITMKDLMLHAYNARAVNAPDAVQSSQAFQAAVLAIATMVETSAQSAINAHAAPAAAPLLHVAPGRHRRNSDEKADNDENLNEDSIAHRVKRRRK